MNCKINIPKIAKGNTFIAKCPFNIINPDHSQTPIDTASMTDVIISVCKGAIKVDGITYTTMGNSFLVNIPETLMVGQYSIIISGKLGGRAISSPVKYAFEIVEWAEQSDFVNFISGTEIVFTDTLLIFSADTSSLEVLEETLRTRISEVEAVKAEWQRKVEEISGVAKEAKATENKKEILTAIEKGGGNPSKQAFQSMKRKDEHFYEIEYSEIDYEGAREYFQTHFVPAGGACTALRKGNLLGRNYDWTYDKQVEFLVRTKAHNGRYASIGVAGSISALTTDTIGEYSDEIKYMPFRMLDGINEKGLTANVNMLNHDEQRSLPVEGTTPRIEEREAICSAMLVRYILDNFATPQEACEYIRDYVRVYPPYHDGQTTDLHFALSSKEQLYYLCFEPDNGGVFRTAIADVKDQPLPFVMTNFRMWWASGIYDSETGYYDRFADPDYEYVEKYGMGIERANLCLDFVRDTETEQSVLDFMTNDLRYTKAYLEDTDPQWLTEFVGEYETLGDIARDASDGEFDGILDIVRQRYAERSRETGLTWQTVHSVVYDLDNLTMQLVTQEGSTEDAITIDCFKSLPASKGDLGNIDFSNVAKQGSNPNATNTAILAAIPSEEVMKQLYAGRAEKNNDGDNTYTIVIPYTAKVIETPDGNQIIL